MLGYTSLTVTTIHGCAQCFGMFKNGRVQVRSLGLIVLLFAACLVGSFHHHADFQDHSDCPVCSFVQHVPAETGVPVFFPEYVPVSQPLASVPVLTVITAHRPSTHLSRAPPC